MPDKSKSKYLLKELRKYQTCIWNLRVRRQALMRTLDDVVIRQMDRNVLSLFNTDCQRARRFEQIYVVGTGLTVVERLAVNYEEGSRREVPASIIR